jgi:hypothetical protein
MPKVPVLLVMAMAPAELKLIPGVVLAGVIAVVRLLTLRVVSVVGAAMATPAC